MLEHEEVGNHPDPVDFGSHLALVAAAEAVKNHAMKVKPKQVKDPETGEWPQPDCIECGEPIGLPRLEATGSDMCFNCASLLEEKGKFYAKR